jgi:tripartite-type tricarboxylate transporter receptor subunit TctC
MFAFYGFLGPKNTPPEIVSAIHMAGKRAVAEHRDEIAGRLENLGAEISFGGPEEYRKKMIEHHAFLSEVIKDLKREDLK